MKNISISNDIIPVGKFKANLAKYLKDVQVRKNSLVITQNGKPAGVLISPQEFDKLRETNLFIDAILRGLSDSEQGNLFTTNQLNRQLEKRRANKVL